jgi:hypothetical protein
VQGKKSTSLAEWRKNEEESSVSGWRKRTKKFEGERFAFKEAAITNRFVIS